MQLTPVLAQHEPTSKISNLKMPEDFEADFHNMGPNMRSHWGLSQGVIAY